MLIVFIILDIGVCCKSTERNLTVLSMPVGTSAQGPNHESYSSDTTVERSGDIL